MRQLIENLREVVFALYLFMAYAQGEFEGSGRGAEKRAAVLGRVTEHLKERHEWVESGLVQSLLGILIDFLAKMWKRVNPRWREVAVDFFGMVAALGG